MDGGRSTVHRLESLGLTFPALLLNALALLLLPLELLPFKLRLTGTLQLFLVAGGRSVDCLYLPVAPAVGEAQERNHRTDEQVRDGEKTFFHKLIQL